MTFGIIMIYVFISGYLLKINIQIECVFLLLVILLFSAGSGW